MNRVHNDYGKLVYQVGEYLSDADIEIRFPRAIADLQRFAKYPYAKAYQLCHLYFSRLNIDQTEKYRIFEVSGLNVIFEREVIGS